MYLSRLLLNPRSRQVQRELADPYQMHRTIMSAFPFPLPEDERILFRVEENPRTGLIALLVQSIHPPDWTLLTEPPKAYLLPADTVPDQLPNPAVKPFDPALTPGQTLAFRLLANPTKRLGKNAEKAARKRIGLTREADQLAWLQRKLESAGCLLVDARTGQQEKVKGSLHREDQKHNLSFQAVRFEGHLQINDPDKLLPALRDGIGPAKAFGCGLLSLAPNRG
jgi:CRISPR system Cascade subunit CasE